MKQPTNAEVAVIEQGAPITPVKLTPTGIQAVQHNIQMAQQLVTGVLEKGYDYGHIPGLPGEILFDPGAAKILTAFQCYADHEIIHHQEEDTLISWVVQAKLIWIETGRPVATGLGAASTKEVKYKYRWVEDPESYGYSVEEFKPHQKRSKKNTGVMEYRIPNPEYGELVNTILAMAAKRAEVDAARAMPGVGTALRKLFAGVTQHPGPDWAGFFGWVTQTGLSEDEAHTRLNVKSMKEWLDKGYTLDQAKQAITASLKKAGQGGPAKGMPGASTPQELTPDSIPDLNTLLKVANQLWKLQPAQVWKDLSCHSQADCTTPPWQAFLTLKAIYEPAQEAPREDQVGKEPPPEELPY